MFTIGAIKQVHAVIISLSKGINILQIICTFSRSGLRLHNKNKTRGVILSDQFEKQLAEWNQNRSKYNGIKPTPYSRWQIRGRQVVDCLDYAVILRDGKKTMQKEKGKPIKKSTYMEKYVNDLKLIIMDEVAYYAKGFDNANQIIAEWFEMNASKQLKSWAMLDSVSLKSLWEMMINKIELA